MTAEIIPFIPRPRDSAGLTDRECYVLAKLAPELPGAWHVLYDEDDHGHGSMGLLPSHGEFDDAMTVFLVWRENGQLRLGLGQGDFYAGLGSHPDVEALIDVVHETLEGTEQVDSWVTCNLAKPCPTIERNARATACVVQMTPVSL